MNALRHGFASRTSQKDLSTIAAIHNRLSEIDFERTTLLLKIEQGLDQAIIQKDILKLGALERYTASSFLQLKEHIRKLA
jgi:hypothetical protein